MEIRSVASLNRYLKGLQKPVSQIKIFREHTAYVKRQKFTDLKLNGFSWHGKYTKCKFYNCEFDGIFGFFLSLQDCEFHKCNFRNCRFSHFEYIGEDTSWNNVHFTDCYFSGLRFDEGEMYNIFFDKCSIDYINLGLEATENVWFSNCRIGDGFFIGIENTLGEGEDDNDDDNTFPDVIFEESVLDNCVFIKSDFGNSYFQNASLYMCAFIDCVLKAQSFYMDKASKYPNYATMDFQTILKSENIDFDILQEYFHIHTPDIKKIAGGVAEKTEFKTVFISYSFKDKVFAGRINDALQANGVKTFLWEKDAPGGQQLDDIMENNIKQFDRVLFIASENSIKSKACQFELSQARKKQESTWSATAFYVVHIDNFLFKVEKQRIRPVSKAEEYWENILELRKVNSRDFSAFTVDDIDLKAFNDAIVEVVGELK